MIRKIAKMDRDAAYASFSTFIAEERPNAEQIYFIEQVVDYVVENGYINNVLDLIIYSFLLCSREVRRKQALLSVLRKGEKN